jgi:hypothetical protein
VVTAFEAVFERSGQAEQFHGDQLLVGLFIQHVKALLRLDFRFKDWEIWDRPVFFVGVGSPMAV